MFGQLLALGYEGPETVGTLVAAAAILVAAIVATLLICRGLVLHLATRERRSPPTGR